MKTGEGKEVTPRERGTESETGSIRLDSYKYEKISNLLEKLMLLLRETAVYQNDESGIKEMLKNDMEAIGRQYRIACLRAERKYPNGLQIALVGRSSTGKSALINALLSLDILPVEVTPTTAFPAFLKYDKEIEGFSVIARYHDRSSPKLIEYCSEYDVAKWLEREALKSETLVNLEIRSARFHLLRNLDLTIVDTPGCLAAGDEGSKHSETLHDYLDRHRPLVFYLILAGGAIESEKEEYQEHIKDYFFDAICSKADIWAEEEKDASRILDGQKQLLGLPAYSHNHPLSTLKDDSGSYYKGYLTKFRLYLEHTFMDDGFIESLRKLPSLLREIKKRIQHEKGASSDIWSPFGYATIISELDCIIPTITKEQLKEIAEDLRKAIDE